jgi:hypothetical protein
MWHFDINGLRSGCCSHASWQCIVLPYIPWREFLTKKNPGDSSTTSLTRVGAQGFQRPSNHKPASVGGKEKKIISECARDTKRVVQCFKTHTTTEVCDRLQQMAGSLDSPCDIKRMLQWKVRHLFLIIFSTARKRQRLSLYDPTHILFTVTDMFVYANITINITKTN